MEKFYMCPVLFEFCSNIVQRRNCMLNFCIYLNILACQDNNINIPRNTKFNNSPFYFIYFLYYLLLILLLIFFRIIQKESLNCHGHRKSDTLVNCQLSTVNCQLSTVNCQLWPSHTPQQHPGMFPGGLHTLSGSQYLGKYYFLQFSKGHFFSRSGSASISWHFMTKVFCHEIFNENVKKFLSNFPQTFLTTSWHFILKIQNHYQSSPVTCHLSSRVIWTGHESLGRRLRNSGKFWLCSVCEKIHKTSSTRSILDFSMDIGLIETHLWQEIKTWTKN